MISDFARDEYKYSSIGVLVPFSTSGICTSDCLTYVWTFASCVRQTCAISVTPTCQPVSRRPVLPVTHWPVQSLTHWPVAAVTHWFVIHRPVCQHHRMTFVSSDTLTVKYTKNGWIPWIIVKILQILTFGARKTPVCDDICCWISNSITRRTHSRGAMI